MKLNISLEKNRLWEFFQAGDWIQPSEKWGRTSDEDNQAPLNFVWLDKDAVTQYMREHPNTYVYSIVQTEGNDLWISGNTRSDCVAYLLSKKKVPISEDEMIFLSL